MNSLRLLYHMMIIITLLFISVMLYINIYSNNQEVLKSNKKVIENQKELSAELKQINYHLKRLELY